MLMFSRLMADLDEKKKKEKGNKVGKMSSPDCPNDGDIIEIISPSMNRKMGIPPSPALTVRDGRAGWKQDFETCKILWSRQGTLEGWLGQTAVITGEHRSTTLTLGFKRGDIDDSATFKLIYDDVDGKKITLDLEVAFDGEPRPLLADIIDLDTYPNQYVLLLYTEDLPRRAEKTFDRFNTVLDLDIHALLGKIVASLQGDDEASGGHAEEDEEDIDASWNEVDRSVPKESTKDTNTMKE
jgi:hypothetical protein